MTQYKGSEHIGIFDLQSQSSYTISLIVESYHLKIIPVFKVAIVSEVPARANWK